MSSPFAPDYLFYSFLGALGVLQMVFAHQGLKGVLFVRGSFSLSGLLGAALVLGAFSWFFLSEPRNLSDQTGGMDGNDQILAFTIAAGGAVIVTLLLTSIINYRWGKSTAHVGPGIGALRETTYTQALAHAMVNLVRCFNQRIGK